MSFYFFAQLLNVDYFSHSSLNCNVLVVDHPFRRCRGGTDSEPDFSSTQRHKLFYGIERNSKQAITLSDSSYGFEPHPPGI